MVSPSMAFGAKIREPRAVTRRLLATTLLLALSACKREADSEDKPRARADERPADPADAIPGPEEQPGFDTLDCLPSPPPRPEQVRTLDVNSLGGCALTPQGELSCWGGVGRWLWPKDESFEGMFEPHEPLKIEGFDGVELHMTSKQICARTEAGGVTCLHEEQGAAPITVDVQGIVELGGAEGVTCGRAESGAGGETQDQAPVRCWQGAKVLPVSGLPEPVHALVEVSFTLGCAIAGPERELWCWSFDDMQAKTRPGLDGLVDVAATLMVREEMCAVRGGKVLCWGTDYDSGEASPWPPGSPVEVAGIDDATAVVHGKTGCALRGDGTLACWDPGSAPQARQLRWPDEVDELVGGEQAACAKRRDGSWACWGGTLASERGGGPCVRARSAEQDPSAAAEPRAVQCDAAPVAGLDDVSVIDIEPGSNGWCAVGADGHVRCWGGPGRAALPATHTAPGWQLRELPAAVDDVVEFETVGPLDWCVRRRDGRVACWSRVWGVSAPVEIPGLRGIDEIEAWWPTNVCARRGTSELWCWVQGGTPPTKADVVAAKQPPTPIHALIAGGSSINHDVVGAPGFPAGALILAGDERRIYWATDILGRFADLGVGELADVSIAVLSPGPMLGCGVKANGNPSCWRSKDPNAELAGWELPALELDDAVQVAVAGWLELGYCVVRRDGTVRCARFGPATASWLVEAPAVDEVEQLAATNSSFCARRRDGSVWCWGENTEGALGRPSCRVDPR
jgi:hypothetical protein